MKKNIWRKLCLAACIAALGVLGAACDFDIGGIIKGSDKLSEEKNSNDSISENSSLADSGEGDTTPEENKEYFKIPVILNDIRENGKTYDFANLTKPMVLNFWYVTCSGCIAEMPDINEFYESYNGAVEMVALHSATVYDQAIATEFVNMYVDGNGRAWKDYSIGFSMDVKLGDATLYDILGGNDAWPMTVVVGADGKILYRAHGCLTENNLGEMRSILNSELSIGDESSGNESVDGDMMCTVAVQSEAGMRMAGVTVCATDAEGNVVKEAKVGENGKANFYLDDGEYGVKLKDLPLGYYQTSFGQKISNSSPDASVTLGIELVDEDDRPAGFKYQVGDVMHDFTISTLDGESLTLSEMLEEKDMVYLNFWYATCSPCLTEMPWINNAYNDKRYAGQFEMIAVHSDMCDRNTVSAFLEGTNWNFKFSHNELTDIAKYFTVKGYPTTVIIDRYGVVTLCETGRLENQTECNNLIATHVKNNYVQNFEYGGSVEVPPTVDTEVTIDAPSNEDVNKALGTSGLTYTLDENPYVWPFVVAEVDGRECLMASNGPMLGVDAHNTSSVLNVKVNVPELNDYTDYVFTFDYKISSEYEADYLYVLVDGVIVQKYSGPDMIPDDYGNLYVPSEWATSYAYVPVGSGEHTLSFIYYKDGDTSDGEDTVYIDNLRFAPIGEGQTYVYRDAAIGRNNDNDGFKLPDDAKDAPRFDTYVNVYYNANDKLYHVHSENGPLLFANLLDTSSNWSKYPLWNYLAVGGYLQYTDGGEVVDLKPVVEEFASAELQSLNDYVPVTQELKSLLEFITVKFGSGYENEWLEFCCYYDAYNCEQMENPCAGMALAYAIEIPSENMTEVGDEVRALVDLKVVLNPRGYKYAFTPTVSGVYQFAPDRSISLDAAGLVPIVWITSEYFEYDGYGNLLFPYTATGDYNLNLYLMAGTTYYIAAADSDPYKLGDKYEIVITYLGVDAPFQLKACVNTQYESFWNGTSWQMKANGVRWTLDSEGYARVLRSDDTLGSYIYVDMLNATRFMQASLQDVIEGKLSVSTDSSVKAFNFTNLKIDSNGDGISDKVVVDENGNSYGDCLEIMKGYLAKATASDAEVAGHVKVNFELQLLLELFSQQVHGMDILESWQMMCYYNESF